MFEVKEFPPLDDRKEFSKLLVNLDKSCVVFFERPKKYRSKALHVGFLIETKLVLKLPSPSFEPISRLPANSVLLKFG